MHQEEDYYMRIRVMLKSLVIQMLTGLDHRLIGDPLLVIVFLLEEI
jgi:hypothetical protein